MDFLTYDVLDQNRMFEPKCLDEFPNLKAFMCRFEVMLSGYTFLVEVCPGAPANPTGAVCKSWASPGFPTPEALSVRNGQVEAGSTGMWRCGARPSGWARAFTRFAVFSH